MPVATTTHAGREVLSPAAEKILNDAERKRKQAAAKRAADTLTPLPDTLGKAPLADVPTPPTAPAAPPQAAAESAKAPRAFSFSTEISFKGRVITVHADGMTLSEFSALLDAHGFAPVAS